MNKTAEAIGVIKDIAPSITTSEAAKLAPVVINQANQEPWYQSRVTIGALVAGLTPLVVAIFALFGVTLEIDGVALTNFVVSVGSLIGMGVALYGRWVAKAPLTIVKKPE